MLSDQTTLEELGEQIAFAFPTFIVERTRLEGQDAFVWSLTREGALEPVARIRMTGQAAASARAGESLQMEIDSVKRVLQHASH